MRDSLSLLDRLLSIGESELTSDLIEQLLGMPKAQLLFELTQAIGEGNVKTVLQSANAMIQSGLSPDTLIASLVEHLRNLLILRACGEDSELVEVPGVSMKELLAQAGRFEAVSLAQDIALLEELRRNLRSSQAGRALLDAALVRLALAGQFTSVAGLLESIDEQSPSTPALKKNNEPRVSFRPPPAIDRQPAPIAAPPAQAMAAEAMAMESTASVAVADEEDDDDLPRPGKVWTGPSLAELARQPMKAAVAAPVEEAPATASNVESVDPTNLPQIWQALLAVLATKGPALAPLIEEGRFIGIRDGQAVIRYPHGHETMLKMLDRNGKKEQIRDAFTQVLGASVGIAFECDSQPAANANGNGAQTIASSPAIAPPPRAPLAAPSPRQSPPADSQMRITTELCAALREADPLIRAVMEQLGGEIVRVE
jgi:DNA polymerase-3 subunit gamma/tau